MKLNPYKSCGCRGCKAVPSKIKKAHKRAAHRALRRIKNFDEAPVVSTGYKA
jgi:hypothetical protein